MCERMDGRMWFASCLRPGSVGSASVWEMGGFGSAEARMPGFSRYGAGMGRWMLETEAGTRGNRFVEM